MNPLTSLPTLMTLAVPALICAATAEAFNPENFVENDLIAPLNEFVKIIEELDSDASKKSVIAATRTLESNIIRFQQLEKIIEKLSWSQGEDLEQCLRRRGKGPAVRRAFFEYRKACAIVEARKYYKYSKLKAICQRIDHALLHPMFVVEKHRWGLKSRNDWEMSVNSLVHDIEMSTQDYGNIIRICLKKVITPEETLARLQRLDIFHKQLEKKFNKAKKEHPTVFARALEEAEFSRWMPKQQAYRDKMYAQLKKERYFKNAELRRFCERR